MWSSRVLKVNGRIGPVICVLEKHYHYRSTGQTQHPNEHSDGRTLTSDLKILANRPLERKIQVVRSIILLFSFHGLISLCVWANFRGRREHLWPLRLALNQLHRESRRRDKFSEASLVCQQRKIRPLDAQLGGFAMRGSLIWCCETETRWKWQMLHQGLYTSMCDLRLVISFINFRIYLIKW